MTKVQMKSLMALLDAIGVPDSAEIRAAGNSLSPASFELGGANLVYSLDAGDHWVASAGNPACATSVIIPVV